MASISIQLWAIPRTRPFSVKWKESRQAHTNALQLKKGSVSGPFCLQRGEIRLPSRERLVEGMKRQSPERTAFARELRRRQPDAEALLWSYVRNRGLVRAKFRRQHPSGPYVADFA
ncbi:MAG: DUF559 domain-containing protein, partial [Proteobacteria bacterium]|nr:DUF559 domain-containing protein [Pseudomonadota bacterium]